MHKVAFLSISVVLIIVGCGVVDDQRKIVAEGYIEDFREEKFEETANYLYCPESLTDSEISKELSEISRALKIVYYEFGSPDHEKYSTSEDFLAVAIGCGAAGFWQEHPPSKQIIFEVRYPDNEPGFIVFSYSLVNGKYVLAFVNHGFAKSETDAGGKIYGVLRKLENNSQNSI